MSDMNAALQELALQELEAARSAVIALMGLNAAVDGYWNGGRTDETVKLICYWQLKAKEALAQVYPVSPPNVGGSRDG